MNLPNKLTVLRIFIVPFMVAAFYIPWEYAYILSAVLFIIAAITDTVRAVRKPESAYKKLRGKDIYIDYYATREEAETAVREARRENTP